MVKRRNAMLWGLLATIGSGLVIANAQSNQVSQVLHEDIAVPESEAVRTAKRIEDGVPVIGPPPKENQNPTAIASQGKLLPQPDKAPKANASEPVHGRNEFGADRQTESKLDYSTEADDTLRYIGVYNPSIVPFKRMSAMDSVRSDYTLYSAPSALADLVVGGKPSSNHDLFWGSIMVDLSPGDDIPIASVSPTMRVLSYEATPPVNLTFSKDASDNFYLRTDEAGRGGTYRVNFLVEASPTYFAAKIPDTLRTRDIPDDLIPAIPASVRKVGMEILGEMRLHRNMLVRNSLDKLVYYFRSFDAKAPPPRSGNIYRDLYSSQAGVCRHRSFAFMITANVLGIPTRYVTNEAHAWVEVWLPTTQWMRIDLGGAAAALDISNASDKSMYRPRGEDPFSKPDSYSENYTRLEGDIKGLRPDQIAERQQPYDGADGSGTGNGSFFGVDDGDGSSNSEEVGEEDGPLTGPGSDLPTVPDEDLAGKDPTYPVINSVEQTGYRGDTIAIFAQIVDERGNGIEGLRIDIFLAPAGNEGNDALLVGRGFSGANGDMQTDIELPIDLDISLYEVFVSTNGNDKYQQSVSE